MTELVTLSDLPVVAKPKRLQRQSYRLMSLNAKLALGEENNEYCEICERDGNLLCCDTCTLVFHLSCVRPKIDSIPRGNWSCPYCVLDVSCSH